MTKEQEQQVLENQGLLGVVIKKFQYLPVTYEEAAEIGMIGLCKGVKTYDVEKGYALTTYLTKCIYNELLMYMRSSNSNKRKANIGTISLNTHVTLKDGNDVELLDYIKSNRPSVEEEVLGSDMLDCVYSAIDKLNDKKKTIICHYFGIMGYEEKNQSEIGAIVGLKQSVISRHINRIIKELKKDLINNI